ncbi:MFS general substrate transporter [Melanomma pulvis-pyrius CBS 109.77]|uniref:MFS general substrate transporter n=1 Tax=Melanomma pulvis-pyrius CBS 109.77 TaxID=1314802 RepID=A0A6A6X5N9_9PLEO|nr:MFS general substrate transporter [Melanomma pulvis-pyrius CBS 109.77]
MDTTEPKTEPHVDSTLRHESPRTIITERYRDLLLEQESLPDRVFISGYSLRELDPNLVVLDEAANEHPLMKISSTVGIVRSLTIAGTIFAPSVHLVMADLNITDSTIGALQVSIFLFAYAIGPLFLAPLSEIYGRTIVTHVGNFIFVTFSIGAGFAKTTAQFSVCRFLSGIGGSASIAVLGGLVADIWDLSARPKASGVATLGPVLGPILGPVCGGWMSQRASWRWTLWVPAIASSVIGIAGFFAMSETYAPRILQNKLRKTQTTRPNARLYTVLDLTSHPTGARHMFSQFARPVIYLVVDPALLLASIFLSVIFGVIYLIIVTFADVFGSRYHHSVGIIGTDFLAIGLGMIIGTIGTIKAMEAIFTRDNLNGKVKYQPESRLLSCIIGGTLTVGGLFMYGFSAGKTHFIVPLIGSTIFAMGAMNVMLAIQLYTLDGFKFPASAFAALSVLRCIFAGVFPLFGEKLFEKLGVDWGVALLAFLVVGIGLPLVTMLYVFGQRLRKIGVAHMEKFEMEGKR